MTRTLATLATLLVLALVPASAAGQGLEEDTRHLASEVACRGGQPYVARSDSIQAAEYGISRDETLLHEAVHLKQLDGACEATLARWVMDPMARLEAEVEATCIGLQAVPQGKERERARYRRERVLFDVYARLIPTSAGPPFGVVSALFERWC